MRKQSKSSLFMNWIESSGVEELKGEFQMQSFLSVPREKILEPSLLNWKDKTSAELAWKLLRSWIEVDLIW